MAQMSCRFPNGAPRILPHLFIFFSFFFFCKLTVLVHNLQQGIRLRPHRSRRLHHPHWQTDPASRAHLLPALQWHLADRLAGEHPGQLHQPVGRQVRSRWLCHGQGAHSRQRDQRRGENRSIGPGWQCCWHRLWQQQPGIHLHREWRGCVDTGLTEPVQFDGNARGR